MSDERRSDVTPEAMESLIGGRRSVRGFSDQPVPTETIVRLLRMASRAPSGSNIQPWNVYVLRGSVKSGLTAAIMRDRSQGNPDPQPEYSYPEATVEPWLTRRRKVGWDLYSLLGIERGQHAAARHQIEKNYNFFGAPVGLLFTLDRNMGRGIYLELGMFMQTLMLAARSFRLDTCPQAAFAFYHAIAREQLRIPDNQMVMCGMALGHIDLDEPANGLRTVREPVENFATFLGE